MSSTNPIGWLKLTLLLLLVLHYLLFLFYIQPSVHRSHRSTILTTLPIHPHQHHRSHRSHRSLHSIHNHLNLSSSYDIVIALDLTHKTLDSSSLEKYAAVLAGRFSVSTLFIVIHQNHTFSSLCHHLHLSTDQPHHKNCHSLMHLISMNQLHSTLAHIQPTLIFYSPTLADHTSHIHPRTRDIAVPFARWDLMLLFAHLPLHTLQQWHRPRVQIQVITYNRPHSLRRLMHSLLGAHYLGDVVDLTLHIEHAAPFHTLNLADSFSPYNHNHNNHTWLHGEYTVNTRFKKAGLQMAIVESWYPTSPHQYAILLEDDIEVSPLFYVWVKLGLLTYRYTPPSSTTTTTTTTTTNTRARVSGDEWEMYVREKLIGLSLYTPRVHEVPLKRARFDPFHQVRSLGYTHHDDTPGGDASGMGVPFLFQVPCSWGAVYFPEPWREFLNYMTHRTTPHPQPQPNVILPKSLSNNWKNSWKRYMIEMVVLRGYAMLYPNYWNQTSFSTNHLELGTHMSRKLRERYLEQFEVGLVRDIGVVHVNEILDVLDRDDTYPRARLSKTRHVANNSSGGGGASNVTVYELDSGRGLPVHMSSLPVFDLWGRHQPSIRHLVDAGFRLHMDTQVPCPPSTSPHDHFTSPASKLHKRNNINSNSTASSGSGGSGGDRSELRKDHLWDLVRVGWPMKERVECIQRHRGSIYSRGTTQQSSTGDGFIMKSRLMRKSGDGGG